MGIFEMIHDQLSPASMALSLKKYSSRYHGAIGLAWLNQVVANRQTISRYISDTIQTFVDIVIQPLRNPQDEDFHDLISERYERASTIITSNLDYSEWGSAFPNRLLATATIDRLRHNAYRITLDGPSYRGERETKKRK